MASGYSLSGPLLTRTLYPCPILNGVFMPRGYSHLGWKLKSCFVHYVPSFGKMSLYPSPLQSQLSYSGGRRVRWGSVTARGKGVGQDSLTVRSCGASCPIWPGPLAWVWITGVRRGGRWRGGAGIWAGAGSAEAWHRYLLCGWRLCFFTR